MNKIYVIRNQKVMLDSDLAELYGVETKRLNEQVARNIDRFPEDFMFQLSQLEWNDLKSQFATSSWGGRRKLPYVFTEHGVLMLSSVLNSQQAIQVNIQTRSSRFAISKHYYRILIRTFISLKRIANPWIRIPDYKSGTAVFTK